MHWPESWQVNVAQHSALSAQPHLPAWQPVAAQTIVQLEQAPPLAPHSAGVVPGMHVPLLGIVSSQQPPLHGAQAGLQLVLQPPSKQA